MRELSYEISYAQSRLNECLEEEEKLRERLEQWKDRTDHWKSYLDQLKQDARNNGFGELS